MRANSQRGSAVFGCWRDTWAEPPGRSWSAERERRADDMNFNNVLDLLPWNRRLSRAPVQASIAADALKQKRGTCVAEGWRRKAEMVGDGLTSSLALCGC